MLEGVLTHSLAGLSTRQTNMFLDVATILRGRPKAMAMAVWTAWHGRAAHADLSELSRRCLLGEDASGLLVMHDVLVVLGRGVIVEKKRNFEEHYGSRLWVEDGKVVGCEQVGLAKSDNVLLVVY